MAETRQTKKEIEHINMDGLEVTVCRMIGRRRSQEDAHTEVTLPSGIKMFGVFDGHGSELVSNYVSKNIGSICRDLQPNFVEEDIVNIFKQMEKELLIESAINLEEGDINKNRDEEKQRGSVLPIECDILDCSNRKTFTYKNLGSLLSCHMLEKRRDYPDVDMNILTRNIICSGSGSTAIIGFIDGIRLVVASLGDSQGIMGKEIEEQYRGVDLQRRLHQASNQEEHDRVVEAGGHISMGQGEIPRVGGGLMITRSFGDFNHKQVNREKSIYAQPITAIPEITEYQFTEEDKFIFLGTDGIFDVKSSDEVANTIGPNLLEENKGLDTLFDECYDSGSKDNMTGIVVKL